MSKRKRVEEAHWVWGGQSVSVLQLKHLCTHTHTQTESHTNTHTLVKTFLSSWRWQRYYCTVQNLIWSATQQPWTTVDVNVKEISTTSASEHSMNKSRCYVCVWEEICGFTPLCCNLILHFLWSQRFIFVYKVIRTAVYWKKKKKIISLPYFSNPFLCVYVWTL